MFGGSGMPARAAGGTSSIGGTVFEDLNRNQLADVGEMPMANVQLYLLDGNGLFVRGTYSDADGKYQFTGLADGDYLVQFATPSWTPLRNDWVPTTTGSLYPKVTVSLGGTATADFGWRPIVRSTDLSSPISSYTGPNGLHVESYDDAIGAKGIYDAVMGGTTGSEAQYVTIRFDSGPTSSTVAGWQGSPGSYSSYSAICYDNYISWLTAGDIGVGHEYGHAWTTYYDRIVQQEAGFESYLKARGLYGDPRVNTSYGWSATEMIAEDYRQLLGSAAAQSGAQMNTEIPRAVDVPGLKEFFLTSFTNAVNPSSPTPPPPPSLTISDLSLSPSPVTKAGTFTFGLSLGATVTATITNSKGALVKTLLSTAPKPPGQMSLLWDRKNAVGQRVKSGAYTASVKAMDSEGKTVVASLPFAVS